MNEILIVDDEVGIRELLSEILRDEGHAVAVAENAAQAREYRQRARPALVLLDIWMPDTDGLTLLKEWASSGQLTMPVVMMSGHGTIDSAVEATRIGAVDFLEKPLALQKLLAVVKRALRSAAIPITGAPLARLGTSEPIARLRRELERAADFKGPLLLVAEPGAGAEFCAKALQSSLAPWVPADLPAVLAEAPLELLRQARGGILFVENIVALNKTEQKGLLVLIGGLERHQVRLVGQAPRWAPDLVASGDLDSRLFEVFNALAIRVPPLREHPEDIPALAQAFLDEAAGAGLIKARRFALAALEALIGYPWPGNLPQLESTVRLLAFTCPNEEITPTDVRGVLPAQADPDFDPAAMGDLPLKEARDAFEKRYLERLLAQERGHMSRVAEKAGLERTHLYRKLKQLGISIPRKGEE